MTDELTGVCGRCRMSVSFTRDEQYPDLMYSDCCGVGPLVLPEEGDES